MSPVYYQQRSGPGCGGCLLVFLLLVLLAGGAPMLLQVLGALLYAFFFLALAGMAVFWGATYLIKKKIVAYESSQTETHNLFVSLLVQILVKIAQVDGTVSREEVATIRRFFRERLHYGQDQLLWVKGLVKEAMASPTSLEALLDEFRGRFAYEPRLLLLDMIYQVLFSNSSVSESELERVRGIAAALRINPYDQRAIEMQYTGGRRPSQRRARMAGKEAESFDVLGLETGAPFTDIKAAYRRLSMKYHPDKVRHLGEEFRQIAEEKMKALNDAYSFLEERYGPNGPGGRG